MGIQSNRESQVLPPYVTIKHVNDINPILQAMAKPFVFPLSEEDQRDIQTLIAKFDAEGNCSGLAAPQIGIQKQAIVFAVVDSDVIRQWRPDATEFMPKTIWLNPSYEAISNVIHEDYEACFSVDGFAGKVPRYHKIRYEAYTLAGELIQGEATGFLARVIQHEIDHVHGILFVDRTNPEAIMSMEVYRQIRAKALAKKEN